MILSREQIDAHIALRESMDDPFVNGQFRFDPSRLWALINGTNDLIATARAYHDLRDGVTGLCEQADRSHDEYLRGLILDRFIVPSNVTVSRIRAVVARVEET